jgi:hypothetical protein
MVRRSGRELGDMLRDAEPARADRVIQALMRMDKLDLDALRQPHKGATGA